MPIGLLCELAPDASADAVADALGFESVSAAVVVFTERPGTIVLDNCEHVLAAVRQLVGAIRSTAPAIAVLTTTREPIGLIGEHVFVVDPLELPAPGGTDAERAPAVELFLERAAAAGAVVGHDPQVIADVAELCRRLDGLPLAIELAAARTRALAPGDLLEVVDQRIDVLRRTRHVGDRHDTMRAAIEVSTAVLPPDDRAFFRRLGVFTGPFDLGLAHAVAGDPGSDRLTSIDRLGTLVDRSLVTVVTSGPTSNYRMLELLHDHARDELREAGELTAVEERFVDAMLAVADAFVNAAFDRWEPALLAAASGQYTNLVRACELCLDRDPAPDRAYRLVLPMFAAIHAGRPNDVWELGRRVLERWPDQVAPWGAEARAVLSTAAAIAGRNEDVGPLAASVVDDPEASLMATAIADRASGLAARSRDPGAAARHFRLAKEAASDIGVTSLAGELQVFEAGEVDLTGQHDRAVALLDDVLDRAQVDGDHFLVVLAHLVRARVMLRAGDVPTARTELAAAEDRSAQVGDMWWSSAILRTGAAVASFGPGGWAGSTARWREALDDAARGAVGEIALTLRVAAASVAVHLGERDVGATLFASAPRSTAITVLPELVPEATAELVRDGPPPVERSIIEALATARSVLGPDQAVAAAAAARPPSRRRRPPAPASWHGRVTAGGSSGRAGRPCPRHEGDRRPRRPAHAAPQGGSRPRADGWSGHRRGCGPRPRRAGPSRLPETDRGAAAGHRRGPRRSRPAAGRTGRSRAGRPGRAAQRGVRPRGRSRATGSSAERARTAVTYRIRSAIRKLSELHPELGRHLGNAVRTGTWCSYQPERDIDWTVELRS